MRTRKLLLLTSPMVQINTPYPATAHLKGFIDHHFAGRGAWQAAQADPALELVLRLLSRPSLERLRAGISPRQAERHPGLAFFLEAFDDYHATVEQAVSFLQGRSPSLAAKIAARELLPEGPRFLPLREEPKLAGELRKLAESDQAEHLASLYLDDLADYLRLGADPRFEFSRYGEQLAASRPSFEDLRRELERPPSLVDETLEGIVLELLSLHHPDAVGISVPFSGTVYGALRMGKLLREREIPVLLGGGYCNTELRRLEDPRIFDYVDFISLDDGERPLLCLLEHLEGRRARERLRRTYFRDERNRLVFVRGEERDIPFAETGCPSYAGLPTGSYVRMFEMLNPVNRLWSGYFWNKLALAHGCYWHRCSFCDTSLDYIGRYEAGKAGQLADRMERLAAETGRRGFHFVDEAAPPAILRALSEELLRRGSGFEWWGNVRFDKAFTPELAQLMRRAGCIAVTGGLEVASPRVLALIEKGLSVEQAARVTHAFRSAGIFVHAYLMYGFPTQTTRETVDSLEVVRQLFAAGCIQSGFWHRFSATVHSPVGRNPEKYGIELRPPPRPTHGRFAENDVPFLDPSGVDHEMLGEGLRRAVYNFMHGQCLTLDVRDWFARKVPKTKIPARLIADSLKDS